MEAPKKIWLKWYGEWAPETDAEIEADKKDHGQHDEVTWCHEKIHEPDVQYIRADMVLAAMPKNWQDDNDTAALAELLGMKAL